MYIYKEPLVYGIYDIYGVYMMYIYMVYIWCICGILHMVSRPYAISLIYIYIQYTMYDYIRLYMVYAPTYHMGALPMEYQQFRSLHCQVFWGSVSTPAEELKSSNWFIGKLFIKPAARSLRIMQVSSSLDQFSDCIVWTNQISHAFYHVLPYSPHFVGALTP